MSEKGVDIIEKGLDGVPIDAAIVAFPGTGMSATIALTHIIDKLNLKQVGHIRSPKSPHVVLVHKNRPAYPIRLYYSKGILAVLSELPILSQAAEELNNKLVSWLKNKKVVRTYVLGGLANPKRASIKQPRIFAVSSDKAGDDILKKKIKPIREGAIFGEEGLLLLEASEQRLPMTYIMADAFVGFPDPDSAASLISALNDILGITVETSSLRQRGDDVKKRFDSLMTQAKGLFTSESDGKDMAPMYR